MSAAYIDIVNGSGTPKNNRGSGKADNSKELEALLQPFPNEKKSTGDPAQEQFSKEITHFIVEALPKISKDRLGRGVKHLVEEQFTVSEEGLALWKESYLPSDAFTVKVDDKTDEQCDYFTKPIVRESFMNVVLCCQMLSANGKFLDSKVALRHVSALAAYAMRTKIDPTTQATPITRNAKGESDSRSKIPSFDIDKFTDNGKPMKEWIEKVEIDFGSNAVKTYLKDEAYCNDHIDWSEAFVHRLNSALADGHLSWLGTVHKDEKNCARYWNIIQAECNEDSEKLRKQLDAWNKLFNKLTLSSIDEWNNFNCEYNTCVSKLRQEQSIAVTDSVLLQAIIMRAVSGKDFEPASVEIAKGKFNDSEEILKVLKDHAKALQSQDRVSGDAKSSRTSRRATSSQPAPGGDQLYVIPKLPSNLKDHVSAEVYSQLLSWRSMSMKRNLTDADKRAVNDFKIDLDRVGRTKKAKRKNDDDYDNDRNLRPRGTSSRHSHQKHRDRSASSSRSREYLRDRERERDRDRYGDRGRDRDRDRDRDYRRYDDRNRHRDGRGRGRSGDSRDRSRSQSSRRSRSQDLIRSDGYDGDRRGRSKSPFVTRNTRRAQQSRSRGGILRH